MKMNSNFAALMIGIILLGSCKKDESVGFDSSSMTNESIASFAEKSISNDEDAVTMRGMMGGGGCNWQDYLADCVTVTESSEDYPKTITIDYGDGCIDNNGHEKSGQIIIDLTDDILNEGAVRTVTFNNFYINNIHIEGSRVLTNTGLDSENHPVFNHVVDVDITNNLNTFQRNFSGTVTWIQGHDTPACWDNVLKLEGSGTVIRPNGVTITRTITSPLILDQQCGYITQGVIEINAPLGTLTMNFGDGTCDNIAVVTNSEGETQTIYLGE